jgi:hypothetical protein
MKHIVTLFGLACVVLACDKNGKETANSNSEPVKLPMEVSYKGTPEMGSMNNVQIVMECNRRLSELNPDIKEFLADTVTWHMADGADITAPRDSVMSFISKFIGSLSNMKLNYTAAVPVNNPDMNHEWVFSWTDETYTYKDGKVEHQFLHEDYRLEGGKIREIFQYSRKPPVLASK